MERSRRDWLLLAAIGAGWLLLARLLANESARYLPRALARQLTLHSFLSLVLVVATVVGLGACFLLLARPREDLGLTRPRVSAIALAALVGPLVLVASAWLGYRLALPTLMAEIARGGRQAAQSNTGQFGRALVQTHAATTIVWAIVLTPVAEELIFRGAIWSALARLTRPFAVAAPRSLPPELVSRGPLAGVGAWVRRVMMQGGLATLGTAGLFAWMHADQQGGAGIVRVVQTATLGVALGTARQASGTLWAPMALHAVFNLLTIAKLRKWFVSTIWPKPLPIATLYWQIAAVCLILIVLLLASRLASLRHARAHASVWIDRPREQVFALLAQPDSFARIWSGKGPFAGASMTEIVSEGGLCSGALRRVHLNDDSISEERVTALDPPGLQAYALLRSFPPPVGLLVSGGHGRWQLCDEDGGTRVEWCFTFELASALAWPLVGWFRRPFAEAMREALDRLHDLAMEPRPPSA
jgi:membrane protease YdiL (CAAX protease family)/uncharacterized protein YndB with AHSA1/START domain